MNDQIFAVLCLPDGKEITDALEELISTYGRDTLMQWRDSSKHKAGLIHHLVAKRKPDAIVFLHREHMFDVDMKRESDQCTPLHLAGWSRQIKVVDALLSCGAATTAVNSYGETPQKALEMRERASDIVWLDLELTSLDDPEIMECVVVITDKDLHEKAVGKWVINFEKEFLDCLGEWHQKNFCDQKDGGNGLFADCIASSLTTQDFEQQLLEFLKLHCVEGYNSLAGSSVHCDKEVLRLKQPTIYSFLHHRNIDVSTLARLCEEWNPTLWAQKDCPAGNHRAEDDIRASIALLRYVRLLWPSVFT